MAEKKNNFISFRERSPDNHTQFQTKNVQNLYPFSDQNGLKTIPFGEAHTYILYIGEYPPPRGVTLSGLSVTKLQDEHLKILQKD